MDRVQAILNASPEKRYKNFISRVADYEKVWLLDNGEGYCTYDKDDDMFLLIWQERKMAELFSQDTEKVVSIEVHKFCELCNENLKKQNLMFMVCPNKRDTYIATVQRVLEDLIDELNKIE